MPTKRAFVISFEGIEGAGKSTQVRRLSAYLRKSGLRVSVFREPGSSVSGEQIRRILLHGKGRLTRFSETMLFIAARGQLRFEKIEPNLKRKDIIILDRYGDATVAYQGYGAGVDLALIKTLNKAAVNGAVPDLTLLLDIEPKAGLMRSGRGDRFERRKLAFHTRVRKGYLQLARHNPGRIKVIRADQPVNIVQQQIRDIVYNAYSRRRKK